LCQIFVLTLIICFLPDSIAHALLRCDIAVSNIWYICHVDVCCLLLLFYCVYFLLLPYIWRIKLNI